jgi:hypothetical protein
MGRRNQPIDPLLPLPESHRRWLRVIGAVHQCTDDRRRVDSNFGLLCAPAGSCGTSQNIGSPERRCWTTMAPPDLQGVCHAKSHLVCGLDWRRSDGCRHHADSGFRFAAAHPKTPAYRAGDTADDLRNPEPTVLAALTAESTRLRISSVMRLPTA